MKKPVIPEEWGAKAPQLTTIAAWINANTMLFAEIEKGYCNTDRKIPGTRLIHPGKGRTGNRLKVFTCEDHKWELARWPFSPYAKVQPERKHPNGPLLDHNAAETYRSNDEVVRWLQNYLESNRKKLKKRS
jgi:hypothetical protein